MYFVAHYVILIVLINAKNYRKELIKWIKINTFYVCKLCIIFANVFLYIVYYTNYIKNFTALQ